MKSFRIHAPLLAAVAIASIVAFSLLIPFAYEAGSAPSTPNVCLPQGSGSKTSSDVSMFVEWKTYDCSGKYEGQSYYEAYSGQKYKADVSATVCGQNEQVNNVQDFAAGEGSYTGGPCYGYYTSATFPLNQLGGDTFPIASGALTVETLGWSGNCSSVGSGSPCYAFISS